MVGLILVECSIFIFKIEYAGLGHTFTPSSFSSLVELVHGL